MIVDSNPTLPPLAGGGLTLSVFTPFASPSIPIGRVGDVYSGNLRDIEDTIR